jgi:hypothetical protein
MSEVAPTFSEWWRLYGEPYERAVIEAGGTPWPLDPAKRAVTADKLGLPADTNPMELRRALWERQHTTPRSRHTYG